ncbi:MAG: DUF3098 domain-containing protein [Chitinophagales bacterium]|nr:DUF3098 domain-containing protein [Chitinophagales bacterium]
MAKTLLSSKNETGNPPAFVFGKINYILMLAGMAVIACGYVLMIGGHPENPAEFNSKELYSATRITIAPIVIIIGLIIEVFAIMVKAKD